MSRSAVAAAARSVEIASGWCDLGADVAGRWSDRLDRAAGYLYARAGTVEE